MKCTFHKPNNQTCGANAVKGTNLCFFHNPDCADKVKEAVAAGGRNRKNTYQAYGKRIKLDSPGDIKLFLSEVINNIWTGKMPANSRIGNTLGFLCSKFLEAHAESEFSERLKKIEEKISEIEGGKT